MPSRLRCLGAALTIAALTLLSHPPVLARTMTLHSAVCGSSDGIDIPVPLRRNSTRDDDRGCPTGCHSACAPRRDDRNGDDEL